MNRPCICDRISPQDNFYSTKHCRLCWLFHHDDAYNQLWGGVGLPSAKQTKLRFTPPCLHLGKETGAVEECAACAKKTGARVRLKLFRCAVHGDCTLATQIAGHACCAGCPDRAAFTRNLLFHVYPVRGNGVWQRRVAQFRRRIDQFDGQRTVAIVTGAEADDPQTVKDAFGGDVKDFLILPNNANQRELVTLLPLLETVRGKPGITFYGHAKGVSRPGNEAVELWTDLLYEASLDYPERVEVALRAFPVAGPLKAPCGYGFAGCDWFYDGTFFWFRNADLFARGWRTVHGNWWGSETYPGLHFADAEAGTLFQETTPGGALHYDAAYMRTLTAGPFAAWRKKP